MGTILATIFVTLHLRSAVPAGHTAKDWLIQAQKQVATSFLALSSAIRFLREWEGGLKYWTQPNCPAIRICRENYRAPTLFMKKRFILLEKYYFISGEKTGRTCAKMQTAIFLDSATVNVFFFFFFILFSRCVFCKQGGVYLKM